jgi:hypothetical protein
MDMFRQIAPHGIVKKEPKMSKASIDPMEVQVEESITLGENPSTIQPKGDRDIESPTDPPIPKKIVSNIGSLVSNVPTELSVYDNKDDTSTTAKEESGVGDESQTTKSGGSVEEAISAPAPTGHLGDATAIVTEQKFPDATREDLVTSACTEYFEVNATRPLVAQSPSLHDQVADPDGPDANINTIEVTGSKELVEVLGAEIDTKEATDLEKRPHHHDEEEAFQPQEREAVVTLTNEETVLTHEEMKKSMSLECPFLMSKE